MSRNWHVLRSWSPDLLAIWLGLCVFFVFYGPSVLISSSPYLSAPTGDIATELAGYFHFANDSWRFPLFILPQINEPEGSNLLFIGGVPLLALFAKAARLIFGDTPNLLGAWYALCCALQTHSFFFLMRQITERQPFLLAFASITAALAYAFLSRTGHVSLFAHFLCIYAVGLLVATTNAANFPEVILARLAGLVYCSMLVFAYLAICTTVIFFGAIASLYWLKRLRFEACLRYLIIFLALQVTLAFAAGYFWGIGRADPSALIGFSEYGFNLGSLFLPHKSVLFPMLPFQHPWWEGDFYLGIGILGLWIFSIITSSGWLFGVTLRHWPIAATLAALTIYSLSNRINFLDQTLLTLPLPAVLTPFLGMVRTAGRLFWPVGYLMMAGAITTPLIRFPKIAALLIMPAVLISLLEATGAYAVIRQLVTVARPVPLDYDELQIAMSEHRSLFVFPTFWCNQPLTVDAWIAYQQIELTSARAALSSNSTITARKIKDCARESTESVSSLTSGRLLALMNKQAIKAVFPLERRAELFSHCRRFALSNDQGALCSTRWDFGGADREFVETLTERIGTNETVRFSDQDRRKQLLVSGWHPEPNLAWTAGKEAKLELRLPPVPSDRLIFRVRFFAFLSPPVINDRNVSVYIQGREIASWTIATMDWESRDVPVPQGLDGQPVQIVFVQNEVRSQKELGVGPDPRHLGIAVDSIAVVERSR